MERSGEVLEFDTDLIRVGDVNQVRRSEKIAADGTVLDGTPFVDESMITGDNRATAMTVAK